LDRYYIGHTSGDIKERLRRHNANHKGFTGKANDWTVAYTAKFTSKADAYARERLVKSWKSRINVEKLISENNPPPDS
jgi:putative endonuclease